MSTLAVHIFCSECKTVTEYCLRYAVGQYATTECTKCGRTTTSQYSTRPIAYQECTLCRGNAVSFVYFDDDQEKHVMCLSCGAEG